MATVFKFAVALEHILDFLFFFKTKVIGPGQNFLYNLIKFSFIITSSFKLSML